MWPGLRSTRFHGICALLLLASCGSDAPRFPAAPVILITVDTLRSDHLRVYGGRGADTPAIDGLAAKSVLFERAYSHSTITLPSHATIMTGLLPFRHGVRENAGFALGAEAQTLAEAYKARGYRTAAFVSSMVLRRSTGMARGFEHYDDELGTKDGGRVHGYAQREGSLTLRAAERWLDQAGGGPIFLWIHLYEPHTPYDPPEAYRGKGLSAYDGEIAYVDSLLSSFFTSLGRRGIYDKALILLASDHGEGLGEHGEEEHGLFVYRNTVQVPFLLKLPGSRLAGRRVKSPVGLVDVKATLLGLSGIKAQENDGIDLFEEDEPPESRPLYAEALTPELNYGWHAHRGVVSGPFQYLNGSREELFDLLADPGESNNLLGKKPVPKAAIETLESGLVKAKANAQITEEEKALLASLGYAGSFQFDESVKALDQTAFLSLYRDIDKGMELLNSERFAEAELLLQPMLERFPQLLDVRLMLGLVLRQLGKHESAEHLFLEGLATHPQEPSLLRGLTLAELDLGKWDKAEEVGLKATTLDPVMVGKGLVPFFLQRERLRSAAALAKKVLEQEPSFALGHVAIGRVAVLDKDYASAIRSFERALHELQSKPEPEARISALLFLGDARARSGDEEGAIGLFREGLALKPDHGGLRAALCMALASRKQPREAIAVLDEWVRDYPSRNNYLKAAQTMSQVGLKGPAEFYRKNAEKYADR